MAITLADVMRNKKTDFEKGVVQTWMMASDISSLIPLKTTGTVEVSSRRSNSLATLGFRQRGQMFPSIARPTIDTITDAVFPMGCTIDIDKTDHRDKNLVEDPLAEATRQHVRAAAFTFNDAFINGDHGVDPDSFEGIKVRLATLSNDQTIYAEDSSNELDIRAVANPTTADMQQFLDRVEEAVWALDGHKADICLTDADFIRALRGVLRRLNLYKDVDPKTPSMNPAAGMRRSDNSFNNKPFFEWDGVKYYDAGLKADQVNKIIGNDTIGGEACRPAYFLKLGDEYVHAIQQYAMEVSKPFLLDDGITYRVVVDWPVGIRHIHPKSISALKGTRVA